MSIPTEHGEILDDPEREHESHESEWLPKALRTRPEILEMYERTLPLSERRTFGTYISKSTTEAKHALSHKNVMNMILGFLEESGYHKTKERLEQETKFKWVEGNAVKGFLPKLLQMSIKDVSSALDPSLTQIESAGVEGDPEVEVFDFQQTFEEEDKEPNVNIWDEGPITKYNLVLGQDEVNKTSYIISGTSNKIIEFITSAKQGNLTTRKLVLATYQSWMTPEKLFEKLMERYNIPIISIQQQTEMEPEKFVKDIGTGVGLVLKSWIAEHPKDFTENMIEKLRDFVENRLVKDGRNDLAKMLRSPLTRLMEVSTVQEEMIIDMSKCPDPKVPKNIFSPLLTFDDVPKEEIARQMTLLDNKLFSGIRVSEFLSRNWSKSRNIRSSKVAAIINRFNQMVKWVVSSILRQNKYKERARVLMNFLEIANRLMIIQSYNSMAAIYYGVTHGAVYRLTHTFNELSSDARRTISTLADFLNPDDGYRKYINVYESQKPPRIPFLGAHLQEISLLDETIPDNIGDMVNLEKRNVIYEKIQSMLRYQSIGFNFLPVRQISVFLHKFDLIKHENEMYKLSLLREPKGISATDLVDYEKDSLL